MITRVEHPRRGGSGTDEQKRPTTTESAIAPYAGQSYGSLNPRRSPSCNQLINNATVQTCTRSYPEVVTQATMNRSGPSPPRPLLSCRTSVNHAVLSPRRSLKFSIATSKLFSSQIIIGINGSQDNHIYSNSGTDEHKRPTTTEAVIAPHVGQSRRSLKLSLRHFIDCYCPPGR